MKRPLNDLRGLLILARDGPVGRLADLYFHDLVWRVHALAAEGHLARRIVVPVACLQPSRPLQALRVELTLGEVAAMSRLGNLSARSALSLRGYAIEARDGIAGRLEDLVVDDASWSIAGLVFEARGMFQGARCMAAPAAVKAIDTVHRKVRLRLTRAQLAGLPAFSPA